MPLSGPFLEELERIVGASGLVRTPEGRLVYECDMHTFYKGAPDAVALPRRADEIVEIASLAQGIARADGEIEQLRDALGELAARVRRLRIA
jgi:hypothetical protein